MTTKVLRPFQVNDLAEFINRPRHANLSDPGTGKTAPFNVYCQYLWQHRGVRTLFLMPTSLFDQNRRSFFKFTDFQESDIVMLRGTPRQRQKLMETDAKVFIGSFGFFSPDAKTGMSSYELLKQVHPDINHLGVDEWHMGFGSMTSLRTQALVATMQDARYGCKYFLPMTGTPIDGRLDSIYPMMAIIEPRYYYDYKTFCREHGLYDQYGRIVAWKNVAKVKEILKRHSVRHSFVEVYGPEAMIIEHQDVAMSPKQRAFYDRYSDTQIYELEGEIKSAKHEAEAELRKRQICNLPEAIGQDFGVLAKDELMEVHFNAARQSGKPIIVFAAFNREQERLVEIAEKCGLKVGLINGDVAPKKRDIIDASFRSGSLNCVIASPATVGVGYDWDFVDYMVFYSCDYKDSSFAQGYKRAIRGVRTKPLLLYILYYRNSVEEDILSIVEGKMRLAGKVDETKPVHQMRKPKGTGKRTKLERMTEDLTTLKKAVQIR